MTTDGGNDPIEECYRSLNVAVHLGLEGIAGLLDSGEVEAALAGLDVVRHLITTIGMTAKWGTAGREDLPTAPLDGVHTPEADKQMNSRSVGQQRRWARHRESSSGDGT